MAFGVFLYPGGVLKEHKSLKKSLVLLLISFCTVGLRCAPVDSWLRWSQCDHQPTQWGLAGDHQLITLDLIVFFIWINNVNKRQELSYILYLVFIVCIIEFTVAQKKLKIRPPIVDHKVCSNIDNILGRKTFFKKKYFINLLWQGLKGTVAREFFLNWDYRVKG